jgi:hypothetical protein
MVSPALVTNVCAANQEKRASLDLSKDHLKTFVSRWTDKPYIFDSPRGIISHVYNGKGNGDNTVTTSLNSSSVRPSEIEYMTRRANARNSNSTDAQGPLDCGVNIVGQIRRFSYQLHEDLQLMKTQCAGVDSLRKCSWGEVSVNAQ